MMVSTGTGSRPYAIAVADVNSDGHSDIVVANFGTNSIGVLLGHGNGSFHSPLFTSLDSSQPRSLTIGDLNNDDVIDVAVVNYATFTLIILIGMNNGSFRIDRIEDMGYDSNPSSITLADLNQDNRLDIIVVNYDTSELVVLLTDQNNTYVVKRYWSARDTFPSSVTTGHLNNDGVLDIAVSYSGSGSIGVFLGDGRGGFLSPMTYSMDTRSRPQFVGVGDFNNDSQADIIVVDSENDNLVIFKGHGNGSFSIITRHSTGYSSDPCALVIGDYDNDDTLDVVIANSGTNHILVLTSYIIYPNTTRTDYTVQTRLERRALHIVDMNDDDYLDILVPGNNNSGIDILINLGNGTLERTTEYHLTNFDDFLDAFVIGDINNDHHLDIVAVSDAPQKIAVLLGGGNGTFVYEYQFTTENNSSIATMALSDMNNDDNLDLLTADRETGNVAVYFGYGNGTFMTITVIFNRTGFLPYMVKVDDMNNDNIFDLVVSSWLSDGSLVVLLGYGNGSFQNPLLTSMNGDEINSFTIGDLNNDTQKDLVYTSSTCSCVGVLFGQGNGTFGDVKRYSSILGSQPEGVSLGYYNDDAFIDIVVSLFFDSSINIYLGTENGSFEGLTRLSTGLETMPTDVQFADMNNDNQQDIVVFGDDAIDKIEIFLVHYDADFISEETFATGSNSRPVSLSAGDLDHNGQSDIAVANSGTDNIELLFDYNGSSFTSRTVLSTGQGSHPQSVTLADFNRDQVLDIAVVNAWYSNMNIFLGVGNGSFAISSVYSTGAGSIPKSIVAGDLNKDGRMDLVVANEETNNLAVFLSFDYVSFTTNVIGVLGKLPLPLYIATGDFNNDHLLDLVIVNNGALNFGVYLGYGNGTFSQLIIHSTPLKRIPSSVAVGDMNNDTYVDVIISSTLNGTIALFLGCGNGTFQSPISYFRGVSFETYSITVADIDKDHHLDIVASYDKSDGSDICVFFGYGNGSFIEQIVYSIPHHFGLSQVTIGDLNNDTVADIVMADEETDTVLILFGDGDGTFTNIKVLSIEQGSTPSLVALGHFDRNETVDIVVYNLKSNTLDIFYGYGNGTFSSPKTYSISSDAFVQSIVASDLNNDKISDILVADMNQSNSSFGIFYGVGDGNFTLPYIYSTGLNSIPGVMAIGDFNNDSKGDIAVIYWNQDSIGVFIQVNSEPFGPSAFFSTGNQSQPNSVALADLNNDSYLDIVVANSGSDSIGIFLGYGDGNFSTQLIYSTGDGSHPNALSIDDFNNDQHLDIAVVNTATGILSICLGFGNGNFTLMRSYSTGVSSVPVAVASKDLNRDGDVDIVVVNRGSNEVLIYVGRGDGTFVDPMIYTTGYDARPQSVAIADVNHDGMLDVAVANYGSGYVEILLQTC